MNRSIALIINLITYIFMIWANYFTNSGAYNGQTVADISNDLNTLITPAGIAFSIWTLIFIGILVFIFSSFYGEKEKGKPEQSKAWPLLAVSNILNGLWGFTFLSGNYLLSVIVMVALLLTLIKIAVNLRLELDNEPRRIVATIWWPITIYLGWIIAATLVNVSVYLVSLGIEPMGPTASMTAKAILAVGTLIYILLIQKRNMREAAMVGVWALVWIAVAKWELDSSVAWTALTFAATLLIVSGIHASRNFVFPPKEA